jgi:hypothetical protein
MENKIVFPWEIHLSSVRDLFSRIEHLTEFRGYDSIILDASPLRVAFAEAMVPVVCCIFKYRQEGIAFSLSLLQETLLRRLFINSGWANLIDPRRFPDPGQEVGGNLPVIQFSSPTEQKKFVDKVMERVLVRLDFLDRRALRAIEWSVNELTDNVLNHSCCEFGGLGQLNLRRSSKKSK